MVRTFYLALYPLQVVVVYQRTRKGYISMTRKPFGHQATSCGKHLISRSSAQCMTDASTHLIYPRLSNKLIIIFHSVHFNEAYRYMKIKYNSQACVQLNCLRRRVDGKINVMNSRNQVEFSFVDSQFKRDQPSFRGTMYSFIVSLKY